jgi:MFS family permease
MLAWRHPEAMPWSASRKALAAVALAELLAKSLWFSGTAVIPQLSREWNAGLFDHFWMLAAISLVWGVSVVADSAQFSTITSEVADQRYVGTALTMQTAMGFLLTSVSIRVVAGIASTYGWRWATLSMAAGPALGIVAMMRLGRNRAAVLTRPPEREEITSP